MALGRYSRVDRSSSSSSYGSTVTIVVFVGLCLVGIWMMTSSSIIPDQNVDDVAEEKKYDLDDQVTPVNNNSNDTSNSPLINNNNDTSDSLQFDDNTGFLPEDPRNEESNESLDSDDGPVNLDESKKDKKQLDSEGGRTNGENLSEDAKQGDANASLAKDDGTSNLNTEENKDNTEENKLDESEKDKKHLASEGGWTNNNVGGNLPEDARKGNSNVSLAKDNGTGNSNSQENKENIERSESDEAKIDKKQLDSGGGQSNNSGEHLPEDAMKGDSNVSLAKDDGTGNLYTQENKIPEVSNKEPVFNENVEKSGSGSSESEPDKSSSETNGGKVDQNDQKELFKTHGDKRDSERGQASNNNGNNLGALGFSKEKPDDRRSDPGGNNKKVVPSDKKSEKYDAGGGGKKPYDNSSEANRGKVDGQIEKVDQNDKKVLGKSSSEAKNDPQVENQSLNEGFSSVAQSELLSETITQNGSFSTQAAVSKNEKEAQVSSEYHWRLCNTTAGPDYIPCLDNWEAIRHLRTTIHYEHRERHCPQEPPTCLVPLPEGYKRPIKWPKSRERIWYRNVPHTQLAQLKGHQNWVKVSGEYLTFPGGGTQFKHGALHYIDFIEQSVPDIAWGKRSRVVLDVGCGVASFGGFLFDRNVLAMSVAPKDEHVAQVQLALERGIPAVSAVMGTKRLPYPGRVFDIVHCARCRVPWHIEGGKLLLELNRLLRPGGYFVWSAYPVYQKIPEDVEIWKAMAVLTKAMCWELVNKTGTDPVNRVAVAVFKKPTSNDCYNRRSNQLPPLCPESDDPNAAWNVSLKTCMHKVPVNASERGYKWPEQWPARLESTPYWFLSSQVGVYGKPAPEDFASDYRHWKRVVNFYLNRMGINWSSVRNVMDMEAVYGGFAAALKDLNLWVMNVVSIRSPDTLPIIYERGLFGTYHDWCESFSTYPRSYDILHADHLFSRLKKRCNIVPVVAEVDRILRPRGKLIIRDNVVTINELERMFRSLRWKIRTSYSKEKEGLLCVQKTMWRPKEAETITYAIA